MPRLPGSDRVRGKPTQEGRGEPRPSGGSSSSSHQTAFYRARTSRRRPAIAMASAASVLEPAHMAAGRGTRLALTCADDSSEGPSVNSSPLLFLPVRESGSAPLGRMSGLAKMSYETTFVSGTVFL